MTGSQSTPTLDVLTVGTALVELTPADSSQTIAQAALFQKVATGAAALFACAASRLGARTAILTATGDDELGEFFVAEMQRAGVGVSFVQRIPGQLTSISFASADGAGGKTFRFYRFPGFSDPLELLDASLAADDQLQTARLFDFTESCIRRAGGLREGVLDLARRSRTLGLQVCYAPNWRPGLWDVPAAEARRWQRQAAALSDLLVLNAEEARLISGRDESQEASQALADLGPSMVVITGGGEAPAVVYAGGKLSHIPPHPVHVRYDVGAGDTFHAALVSARLFGLSPVEAAQFAAAAAALKISRPPDLSALPTRGEVEDLLRRDNLLQE